MSTRRSCAASPGTRPRTPHPRRRSCTYPAPAGSGPPYRRSPRRDTRCTSPSPCRTRADRIPSNPWANRRTPCMTTGRPPPLRDIHPRQAPAIRRDRPACRGREPFHPLRSGTARRASGVWRRGRRRRRPSCGDPLDLDRLEPHDLLIGLLTQISYGNEHLRRGLAEEQVDTGGDELLAGQH